MATVTNQYLLWMQFLVFPEKKSAGTSSRPPLHEELFFDDQAAVDQFVLQRGVKKSGVMKDVSWYSPFM